MASSEITLEAVSSISQIPAEDWNACANPTPDVHSLNGLDTLASSTAKAGSCAGSASRYNPFVSHEFFSALEASGSACARTGWGPRHLLARRDGAIAGIVPCYLKSHSQGEYVFDRGWADAYERAGGRYYPKLQASVPFTPAAGPRLLIRDGDDADRDQITAITDDHSHNARPSGRSSCTSHERTRPAATGAHDSPARRAAPNCTLIGAVRRRPRPTAPR